MGISPSFSQYGGAVSMSDGIFVMNYGSKITGSTALVAALTTLTYRQSTALAQHGHSLLSVCV